VIETVRLSPRWAGAFAGFSKPYTHVDPDAYRTLAEDVGFGITRLDVQDVAWDFETRDNFTAFARATFVEWTRRLPESQWSDFITAVLDQYQSIAGTSGADQHTFKFYQMEIHLQAQ
jgi:trans-aconitate 2-methyltransferase